METITLTTKNNIIRLELNILNSGKYVINWGDGSKEEKYTITENDNKAREKGIRLYVDLRQHAYTDNKVEHIITIKGRIIWLDIANCGITSIDTTKCSTLLELHCDQNQLTSLDVSKNAMLKWLSCSGNQLTSLDLSKNTELEWLNCRNNKFSVSVMDKIRNDSLPSGGQLFL